MVSKKTKSKLIIFFFTCPKNKKISPTLTPFDMYTRDFLSGEKRKFAKAFLSCYDQIAQDAPRWDYSLISFRMYELASLRARFNKTVHISRVDAEEGVTPELDTSSF